ncbi:hypothetical protein PIB30_076050 [Stylosanthes scabra]|uniref:Uncharacterized protein n=1 Tax=Stylosanthes scabra TaxID=79078 RepID=A0ABU6XSQ3_9FABA|nr:hypothetical protein [Stylosanthes scabra]
MKEGGTAGMHPGSAIVVQDRAASGTYKRRHASSKDRANAAENCRTGQLTRRADNEKEVLGAPNVNGVVLVIEEGIWGRRCLLSRAGSGEAEGKETTICRPFSQVDSGGVKHDQAEDADTKSNGVNNGNGGREKNKRAPRWC